MKRAALAAALLCSLGPAAGAAAALPDDRGWEMVSPIEKNGGEVELQGPDPGDPLSRAAADGDSVTYSSPASFGDSPQGAPPLSQYVATRSASGWLTQNVSPPHLSGAYEGNPHLAFSGDLGHAVYLNPGRCPGEEPCPPGVQLQELPGGALTPSPAEPGQFEGASANLEHLVFAQGADLYRWSPPAAALVKVNAAPAEALAARRGAVSDDGARVYWQGADGNLYLGEGGETTQVDAAVGGEGEFVAASGDGRFAFFSKEGHLHRFDAVAAGSTDLTPGGEVLTVLGASADGAAVFYLLGDDLRRWREGAGAVQVVTGPGLADVDPLTSGVSAGGERLFFTTDKALRAVDTNNDADAYQWEAQGTGSCDKAGGCVELISSGRAEGGARFVAASANGSDAFFLTDRSLAGADPGSVDLYVARVGGGFPEPPSPIPCTGDSCQSLPSEPVDPTLTTLLSGLGNPKVRFRRALRNCRPAIRAARRASRRANRASRRARRAGKGGPARAKRRRAARLSKRAKAARRAAKRCRRANRGGQG
ncbi:MAG: hypothetical protein WD649_04540 [Thermoleophilaceae bacterium]